MNYVDRLQKIINNRLLPAESRDFAKQKLEEYESGITPSFKTIEKILSIKVVLPQPCSRLEQDNTCKWLRKYGESVNLPVPIKGVPAKCIFLQEQEDCPGYKNG